jgi:thioredoxin 1
MKKIGCIAFLAVALLACNPGNNTKQSENDGKDTVASKNTTIPTTAVDNDQTPSGGVPISISEDEFVQKVFDFRKGGKWKYKGDKPAIIDFYADWCGPCRTIAPFMKEFAATYKDKIYVYKVNTDYAQDLSMFFSINAIPAVMYCPTKGDYVMEVGASPKEHYQTQIQTLLLK